MTHPGIQVGPTLELAVGSCTGVGTDMDVVAAVTRTFLV